jgi:hypothetical protein
MMRWGGGLLLVSAIAVDHDSCSEPPHRYEADYGKEIKAVQENENYTCR